MIKVTETKLRNDILVAEAKLVLINGGQVGIANLADDTKSLKHNCILQFGSVLYPILISEIEKIQKGDCAYDINSKSIFQVGEVKIDGIHDKEDNWFRLHKNCCKVIVLPEHFSSEQLQMIVDGKLKDGDKVLIECEDVVPYMEGVIDALQPKGYCKIKLNPHITVYPIQERVYTSSQIALLAQSLVCKHCGDMDGKWNSETVEEEMQKIIDKTD